VDIGPPLCYTVIRWGTDARRILHAGMLPLFIGSQDAAANGNMLTQLGVGYVCNAAADAVACFFEQQPPAPSVASPLCYLKLHLLDIPEAAGELRADIVRACEFLDDAFRHDSGCLVHCNAGVSRSSAIIIAWLVRFLGLVPPYLRCVYRYSDMSGQI
jgi:hypothetical protein